MDQCKHESLGLRVDASERTGHARLMHTPVIQWLLSLITMFAPPDKLASAPQLPGYEETADEKTERYRSIAEDLYRVVYDSEIQPLFGGPKARAHTAALVLGVAFHESGFAKDVDVGPCYVGKVRGITRCDGGRSACLMQILLDHRKTPEGWSQADLFADRTKCFRAGLGQLRKSMTACSSLPADYQLSAYATGVCGRGFAVSKQLVAIGNQFFHRLDSPNDAPFILRTNDNPDTI